MPMLIYSVKTHNKMLMITDEHPSYYLKRDISKEGDIFVVRYADTDGQIIKNVFDLMRINSKGNVITESAFYDGKTEIEIFHYILNL